MPISAYTLRASARQETPVGRRRARDREQFEEEVEAMAAPRVRKRDPGLVPVTEKARDRWLVWRPAYRRQFGLSSWQEVPARWTELPEGWEIPRAVRKAAQRVRSVGEVADPYPGQVVCLMGLDETYWDSQLYVRRPLLGPRY